MPDTLKTCTREEVWKELNIEYWTNDRIRTGLGIDKPMYHKIYAVLEAEINALGKLYEKINNITAKQALQPGFSRIIKMFPAVFEGVNLPWLEQCLIHWAQRYNNNRKRRQQTAPGRMAIDAGLIGNDALPRANPPAFGNVILEYTRRTAGRTMRCRPRDLLLLDIATMDITLDDLRFDLFLKVLREDIAFDAEIKSIYCKSKKTRKLECNTARLWKYALSEMYSLGITTILFVIDCTTTASDVPRKRKLEQVAVDKPVKDSNTTPPNPAARITKKRKSIVNRLSNERLGGSQERRKNTTTSLMGH